MSAVKKRKVHTLYGWQRQKRESEMLIGAAGGWSMLVIPSVTCNSCCQTMDYMQKTTHSSCGPDSSHCQLKLVNFEAHDNHISHETQGLSQKHLVVRRGKPFKVTLLFRGSWNPRTERLVLEVWLGDMSERIPVQFFKHGSDPKRWSAKIYPSEVHPKSVTIYICSPVQSSVAVYHLVIHIETTQTRQSYKMGAFVLLCNPWLKDDPVYMPLDAQIQEYIKSDYGLVYMGTHLNITRRPWSFGQYEPGVLDACLTLLQVSPQHLKDKNKDYILRSNPVYLSRVICAMVNCNDDLGILEGKWHGSYKGGVKPTEWSGSADILHHWVSSNCSPVRYGQCWVFASVLCTVMRVLGIPSRVVTAFNSAHDSNGNLKIEEYYSSQGEKLSLSKDSIWNFHVWVECWMRRPDLGAGFDGWQVVDPTPQEKSAGIFCCGPCPVVAIQQCCLDALYDTSFVYASVDADVIQLIVRDGLVVGRKVDTEWVGKLIYTKSIGSDTPQDLTQTYKTKRRGQPVDTVGRSAWRGGQLAADVTVNKQSGFTSHYAQQSTRVLLGARGTSPTLEVSLNMDGVPSVGESIAMRVTVTNLSSSPRILMEHLNAQVKEYNSNPQESFWKTHKEVRIQPGEVVMLHHTIPPSEYESVLVGDDIVNVAVVIKDVISKERVLALQEFNIKSPQITIEIEGGDSIQTRKEHTAQVSFINTFTKSLRGAVLTVEGSGLLQGKHEARLILLQPGERIEKTVSIMATSPGTKLLMATFSHSQSPSIVSRRFHKVSVATA
ncbi:protein-glutamine gamma-glutamyltransferase 5-like isoform X3 [Epinephelus fuscoguttatus]|uniref:protein-glutamine gamma-glutamyltransferase 5-like isoform X3 n=1 Tax=Epinephelus fuscoguttatus TaxID=293821 RepID=UPI0020D1AB8D|nr:protein-glutamine gamma-glutamyltransferase 5-like isoform X3 [Epinephelus fuscoguttatus]